MSILVSIEDLLSGAVAEVTLMEFKKGWNDQVTTKKTTKKNREND